MGSRALRVYRDFQNSKNSQEGGSVRDASDPLDFPRFDKVEGLDLLDNGTEKQNLASTQRR